MFIFPSILRFWLHINDRNLPIAASIPVYAIPGDFLNIVVNSVLNIIIIIITITLKYQIFLQKITSPGLHHITLYTTHSRLILCV